MMSKSPEEYFRDWESCAFGFGYGSGETHVLEAVVAFFDECPATGSYDFTKIEKKLTPTVAWLLINMFCHLDLIEYGTSPRFGWLTKSGQNLKSFVNSKTAGDLVSIATGYGEDYVHCHPHHCNCDGSKCDNPFWTK